MRPIADYTIVEYSPVTADLRVQTDIQTDNGLLWLPSNRMNPRGGAGIGGWEVHNRSSAAINFGIGFRIANNAWIAGKYVAATTTFTDQTTAAQDRTTNDFTLESTTDNDGFIVACKYPFNGLAIDCSTTGATGAPAVAMSYSILAANYSTAFTTTNAFDAPDVTWTAGTESVVWIPPADWAPLSAAAVLVAPWIGLPIGYYAIIIQKTTAQTGTAALARAMEVWRLYDLTEGLADNATATKNYFPAELYQQDVSGVGAYITSVAALQSRVTMFVRER